MSAMAGVLNSQQSQKVALRNVNVLSQDGGQTRMDGA